MDLCDRQTLEAVLTRHGFRFARSMGQNFLIDPEIPRRIAEVSGADKGSCVLEIGPGVGALTAELAARSGRVLTVEVDRTLLPVLGETLGGSPNVEVISGDALRLDLAALVRERGGGLSPMVCANLPYNITTPVLTKLLSCDCFSCWTVLVQREAARRLCAAPGSGESSLFSLQLQYRMTAEILFDVPPECFLPAPKVTSSVVRCVRRAAPAAAVGDEALFQRVLRGAFLLRRKTLSNSLSSALPELDRETVVRALGACGLPADIRGERLTLEQFAEFTDCLAGFRR